MSKRNSDDSAHAGGMDVSKLRSSKTGASLEREDLDDDPIARTDRTMRFPVVAIDLDAAATAGTLRLRAGLEQTRHIEPDVEPNGFQIIHRRIVWSFRVIESSSAVLPSSITDSRCSIHPPIGGLRPEAWGLGLEGMRE